MGVTFELVADPDQSDEAVQFLSAHEWPFHARSRLSLAHAAEVTLMAHDVESFVMREGDELIGLVRLLDLDDLLNGSPLFDLRIASEHRGRGVGREAVTWLSGHLFGGHPELHRIEATTREDNVAMMAVLERCGYRREGALREAWRSVDGDRHDAMIYGLLRREWASAAGTSVGE